MSPAEAGIWEALRSLADQARFALSCGDTAMYAHRHHQIDHVLSQWEQERDPSEPSTLDRIKLVRGV